MSQVRIGISGWIYPNWRGDFYPAGLVQRKELAYAAERLGSIEINGSFYSLQRPASYASWRAQTPDDFVFALRALTTTDRDQPLHHTVEARHPSFAAAEAVEMLRAHDVAVTVADTAGKWPFIDAVTSDFVYVRLHGADELYVSGYTDEALDHWADRVRTWLAQGLDVYVYFDNDAKVHAPYDAMRLQSRLAQG